MRVSHHRVLQAWLHKADLHPPLGYPGGPCHVVDRIITEVDSPRLEDHLIDNVENGRTLSNPEIAAIYGIEIERGAGGPFQRMSISPHAQYRMDLRGINVPLLRRSLQNFLQHYNNLKSRGGRPYDDIQRQLSLDVAIRWEDRKTGLTAVFVPPRGSGTIKIITTYWTGESDPKAFPGQCRTR